MQPANMFFVREDVLNKINEQCADPSQRSIVIRCVGGYSQALSFHDRMEKVRYRWNEYSNSYPDWNQSCKFLDTRKAKWMSGNDLAQGVVFNLALAPLILFDYSTQESGLDKLKKLIAENNLPM